MTRSMARKLVTHKKHVNCLEAPRNSLELRLENSERFSPAGNVPAEDNWSRKNCYPLEASMKKLINEEISKHPSARQNAPSIVARLMGMDVLTTDVKSIVQQSFDKKKESKARAKHTDNRSVTHDSSTSSSSGYARVDFTFRNNGDEDSGRWGNNGQNQKSGKQKRREHPQEEELQQFKKDFEAWQTARFRECSRFAELGNTPTPFLDNEKPLKTKAHAPKAKTHDDVEDFQYNIPSKSKDFEQSFDEKLHISSVPTRIVILKPGAERIPDHRDFWSNSPSSLEQRGSIEDFLEEVRERLKSETQGKVLRKGSVVRGSGIETPYSEKPSDIPKQIAQSIAKHARENVGHLKRSESTRSSGPNSPDFITKDTRRFVADRLKNVLKREIGGHSRSYSVFDLDSDRIRENQGHDFQNHTKETCDLDALKAGRPMRTRSFRHGLGDDRSSPRNLVRSLSAPVSGTSFGKLLLEDRHILTGVHIRRKIEAAENVFSDRKKPKKDRFNFKEKVTSFRYSFSLRGRFFSKKIPLVMEAHIPDQYVWKDITSGPTVVSNFGERHEKDNFTEVPPSPASVCSSVHEEVWRQTDYLSPLSTPDVTPSSEHVWPQVFREISSNLTELRRQLDELESGEPAQNDVIPRKEEEPEMIKLNDPEEAYVRDLLVASGLYDGSTSNCFLRRWETLAKPISVSVFEEVEESYKNQGNDHNKKALIDHKMLHDLLNEALSAVLGQASTGNGGLSNLKRNLMSSCTSIPTLQGNELLKCAWETMRHHLGQPGKSVNVVDDLVSRDLRTNRWRVAMEDVVAGLGRDVESLIMEDLLEEVLEDMNRMRG